MIMRIPVNVDPKGQAFRLQAMGQWLKGPTQTPRVLIPAVRACVTCTFVRLQPPSSPLGYELSSCGMNQGFMRIPRKCAGASLPAATDGPDFKTAQIVICEYRDFLFRLRSRFVIDFRPESI
jgi:hypothetical protein